MTLIGRRGKNRYPIKSDSIAFCFTEDRETWISTLDGKEYMVSSNLDQLENTLVTGTFFRANRKVQLKYSKLNVSFGRFMSVGKMVFLSL